MRNKSLLLIANFSAGQKIVASRLADVIDVFGQNHYITTVVNTQYPNHARELALELAGNYDLVVCAGGDGTLNETISGLLEARAQVPLGYIPSGTTNDFATTLELSRDPVKAAECIVGGKAVPLDIGLFNGRNFVYTASFGAFTRASYATPQSLKNALGHLAYVLEGVKDLANLQTFHLKVTTDGETFEGDYLFGAVSNTTSLAGILTFDKSRVQLDDGKFELLLIESPKNAIELSRLLLHLTQKKYEPPIHLISAAGVVIETEADMDWTLDGEFQRGQRITEIQNLHAAIRVIVPNTEA